MANQHQPLKLPKDRRDRIEKALAADEGWIGVGGLAARLGQLGIENQQAHGGPAGTSSGERSSPIPEQVLAELLDKGEDCSADAAAMDVKEVRSAWCHKPVVITFSGPIGDNSSIRAKELADALHWPLASFGTYIRGEAHRRGVGDSRSGLQQLGLQLLADPGPKEMCRRVLEAAGWSAGMPLVVDGVRHEAVLNALHELVHPLPVKQLFMKLPKEPRYLEVARREHLDPKAFDQADAHPVEQEVKRGNLLEVSEYEIDSSCDPWRHVRHRARTSSRRHTSTPRKGARTPNRDPR